MCRPLCAAFGALMSLCLGAQSLHPSIISCAGGSGTVGSMSLDWTVGEPLTETFATASHRLSQGFHQGDVVRARIELKAFLEGAYGTFFGRMRDDLRSAGLLPLTEPYTALGYVHINGGGETTTSAVLDVTGPEAVVDWLFLELRDPVDHTLVLATRSALLRSNGSVVAADGVSPVSFQIPSGSYHIAVHHRNHLGVMTASPIALSAVPTSVDLSNGSTPTFGTDAQKFVISAYLLWAGDASNDGVVKYTGPGNDRDMILVAIGGTIPTNTVTAYAGEDVNMDGTVKYTGPANDRDVILTVIGGTIPTNTRSEQLP